ncbi:hypothetical protein [Alkalibacillus haloalkaliphilus]|uniref:Uncharacterized protein n=1 Tax=Alkalibacillus haloalkaliphilus TaxID=94136 RepID=A0A511WC45_9BACI|nr:hypothetical protein [Alkalibacillus haloalkaliphilus]GEN46842.1 hypothetical protein AHA02nite_26180 [Alkalibacillus haloalkaliphilus]
MKLINGKLILSSVSLAILWTIFNVVNYYTNIIDEPIVLDHYIHMEVEHHTDEFDLYYVTHKNSNQSISHVDLGNEITFVPSSNPSHYNNNPAHSLAYESFNHYDLHRASLTLKNQSHIDDLFSDTETFSTDSIDIYFSDGTVQTKPINLTLTNLGDVQRAQPTISSTYVNITTSRTAHFQVNNDLTLKEIKMDNYIEDNFTIEYDQQLPTDLARGEEFEFDISYNGDPFLAVNAPLKLIEADESSSNISRSIQFQHQHTPNITENEMNEFIETKGGNQK